ncbi:MAG: hypothetical protein U5L06_12545 [Rhodovibrio sp.]|nr:hypothetical protein [Rhodovibrio sp.]
MQDGLTISDDRRPVANPAGTHAAGACALDANGDIKTPPAPRRFTKDGPKTVQIKRATDIPSGGSWHPLWGGAQSAGVRLKPADPAPRVVGRA